jgi:hypothetical protein
MLWQILTGGSNNGGRNTKGTELQTELEHDKLQDPEYLWPDEYYTAIYTKNPGLLTALEERAKEYELKFPRYWRYGNNDMRTPKPELTSSWVNSVNYDPNSQIAVIQLNGKMYTYAGISPDQMTRFLKSPSLGRVINESKVPHKKGEPWTVHGLSV